MPELPEVEHYRQILLTSLVSGSSSSNKGRRKNNKQQQFCRLEFGPPPQPTKRFPSEQTIHLINNGNYVITNVLRKGKVLCVVLEKRSTSNNKATAAVAKTTRHDNNATTDQTNDNNEDSIITGNEATILLSLHMGMTGRISSPKHIPKLESLTDECSYPPPHTHLIIKSGKEEEEEACFSDPRRFGSVFVHGYDDNSINEACIPAFQELAPDALHATMHTDSNHNDIVTKLTNQRKGIKATLLDQREVMSGIGNWIADEVLYRKSLHPDQSFLTVSEATKLVSEIQFVLSTAVQCLKDGQEFPDSWLFHRRWRGGGGSSSTTSKDFNCKTISFVKSGGRSSGRLYH